MDWIMDKIQSVEGIIATGTVVVSFLIAIWRLWKKHRSALKIMRILLDNMEHREANEPENVRHDRRHTLDNALDFNKVKDVADKERIRLKEKRKKEANNPKSQLEFGIDVDEKGDWQVGTGWKFNF